MNNEELERERARIAQSDRDRAEKERNTSSKERAKEINEVNSARKEQKEQATQALQSGTVNLQEIARQGGSLGRKLEREIRRFEQTGRVSNWLAGETIKAESAQNAAQQGAFRQAVVDVISSPLSPLLLQPNIPFTPSLSKKPEITESTDTVDLCAGLGIFTKVVGQPPNTFTEVWVNSGTIAGQVPSAMDPIDGQRVAVGGSGDVWAEIKINEDTGEITSTKVDSGNSTPSNSDSKFYYTLGYYAYNTDSVDFKNYGCGSLNVSFCRNWFVADPPFFTPTYSRS